MCLWAVLMLSMFASSQNGEYDPEVRALMGKQGKIVDNYKPETDAEKEAHKVVMDYLSALSTENLEKSYGMMTDAYKKYVSLIDYIKKDRLSVEKISLEKLVMSGDECVVARGYLWGYQSKLGETIKVPIRETFFKKDGKWFAYKNPFANSMGLSHPFAKRFKPPCDEPEEVAEANAGN